MTQLLVLLDQPFHRKTSNFELLLLLVLLPGTCTGFSERKFSRSHAHFDCCFFFFFRRGFFPPWCYQKMHYFCLAAKNDFLSLHLHFWLFSLRFSLELFRLFNKPLFFFFCETSGLLNRFDELLKNGDECTQVAKFRFDRRPHDSFKTGNARIRLDFWQNSERLPRESVTIVSVCVCFGEPRLLAKIQSDWDLELGLNFSCCVC